VGRLVASEAGTECSSETPNRAGTSVSARAGWAKLSSGRGSQLALSLDPWTGPVGDGVDDGVEMTRVPSELG
jgi:hypothetical protein